KAAGKTIIITTHYMDEAEKLCTKVVLLKKGKLLSMGTPAELVRKYGGIKVVIMQLATPLSDIDLASIKASSVQMNIIAKGNIIFLPLEQAHSIEKITGLTNKIMEKGYTILSSTTKEPNLEDVFLNITGEHMKVSE
ncbi:MAG: hypothetical protein AABW59_02580, partial [archaeon]